MTLTCTNVTLRQKPFIIIAKSIAVRATKGFVIQLTN